jgi:hypothetical protein
MNQSTYKDIYSYAASKEIIHLLWTRMFVVHNHTLDLILGEVNLVHILILYFLKILRYPLYSQVY